MRNQYFVRYTLNYQSIGNSFTTAVDSEVGITAEQTSYNIICDVRKHHNFVASQGENPAYNGIKNEDIVIQVLTKLN